MYVLRILQLASLLLLASFGMADAKDLSTLQSAVTYARDDMEKAQAAHETNTQSVARQQQVVEERKKQLADESKKLEKMQQDTGRSLKQCPVCHEGRMVEVELLAPSFPDTS